jgi:precorrin-2 dehydrogenase/sirohydrochlorin ferrochelatase
MTPRYPVLIDLAGQQVLVVGGGSVAARKVRGLLAVDAHVTVCAPHLCDDLTSLVDRSTVAWCEQRYQPGDAGGCWAFVVAATDDRAVNASVVADASASGTWANDVTSPTGGPAAVPAVHRDGLVTLAVSTDGVAPGAAAWLRDVAAAAIRPEHVTAVVLAAEVRSESPSSSRPDWQRAVDSGMLSLIREGHPAKAKERLQACLSSSSD